MDKSLQKTQKKLSRIFSLIIFFTTFFLVFIFFSLKFFQINNIEKQIFEEKMNFVIINLNNPNLFKILNWPWKDLLKNSKIWIEKWFRDIKYINFFILDKYDNIILDNTKIDIDYDFFNEWHFDIINKKNDFFYYKINIINNEISKIIFFTKSPYGIVDYLKDLLLFLIFILFFSVWFYYLWLFFSKKVLNPIEENLKEMSDFVHNAGHEIKTPISVINSNLSLIKYQKTYDEELVINSIDEIKRIDNIIESLISLSDISYIEEKEKTNISLEIKDILKEYENEIQSKNLKITFNEKEDIFLKINKNYFYILFSNLLKNAIRYNIEWGYIEIILQKNKLSIRNSSKWIKKENFEKIFNRFYKEDESRNSPWSGIWLSLVKKISQIYSFKINVDSKKDDYSLFEIQF